MSWIDDTVREFGERVGVPGLALGAGGFVQFALNQGGTLGIALAENEVKVWLSRPLAPHDRAAVYERALVQCDFRRHPPFPLQAGLRGGAELVFLARIPERAFTTPALEQALDVLERLHERSVRG